MENGIGSLTAEQINVRRAMLNNGYEPLANVDKRCMLKGWPTLEVTHEQLDAWAGARKWPATGMRLTPGLCAIDVDINDEVAVSDLYDAAVGAVPALADALVRYGKGAKEMWLVRCEEPFERIASASFTDRGGTTHQVEVFGGDSVRQFGVYGAHTTEGGAATVVYRWDGDDGPARVPFANLPMLPKAAVFKICDLATILLETRGWARTSSRAGETPSTTVYDLKPAMFFDCHDGQTRGLDALPTYAATGNARCSASWMEPGASNTTRCIIFPHGDSVTVLETAEWVQHRPEENDPGKTRNRRIADLAASFRANPVFERAMNEIDPTGEFDACFATRALELLAQYAFCASRGRPVVPIYADEETSCTVANLKTQERPLSITSTGPRGGTKQYTPVDVWIDSGLRLTVDGYRYRPDLPPGVFTEIDGSRLINSYYPKTHEAEPDPRAAALWRAFMVHLVPNPTERAWLLDWLAHKYQRPAVPGPAVLMVSEQHGVGRGTLQDICRAVFGAAHVGSINADSLIGNGSQAQYNDWQSKRLLITCEEILSGQDPSNVVAFSRRGTYERLKELVDPRPRTVQIVRKGLPNYNENICASMLLATNHRGALPLDSNDRRFAVITTGEVPLTSTDLARAFEDWRTPAGYSDVFAATVAEALRGRDVSMFRPTDPAPHFAGRAAMLARNNSAFELQVMEVLSSFEGDYLTRKRLLSRVHASIKQSGEEVRLWGERALEVARAHWVICADGVGVDLGAHGHTIVFARTKEKAEAFTSASPTSRLGMVA